MVNRSHNFSLRSVMDDMASESLVINAATSQRLADCLQTLSFDVIAVINGAIGLGDA